MHRRFLISVVAAVLAGFCMGQGCLPPQPGSANDGNPQQSEQLEEPHGIPEGVYVGQVTATTTVSTAGLPPKVGSSTLTATARFDAGGNPLNDNNVPVRAGDQGGYPTLLKMVKGVTVAPGYVEIDFDVVMVTYPYDDNTPQRSVGSDVLRYTLNSDASVSVDEHTILLSEPTPTGEVFTTKWDYIGTLFKQ